MQPQQISKTEDNLCITLKILRNHSTKRRQIFS